MKILSNYRYYILFAIGTIAAVGIFSEPLEDLSLFPWLKVLFVSKLLGFGAAYIGYRLLKKWSKNNSIPELINLISEED